MTDKTNSLGEENVEEAHAGLNIEDRIRLGLLVDAPPPPTFEQMAEAVGEDPEELALMRGIRNQDDYAEAQRNIAALRAQRAEEEERARREQFRKR